MSFDPKYLQEIDELQFMKDIGVEGRYGVLVLNDDQQLEKFNFVHFAQDPAQF